MTGLVVAEVFVLALVFVLARARGLRFEKPIAVERVLFAGAALLLVVSVFIALLAITSSYHDRDLDRGQRIAELTAQLDDAAGLTSCRSKLASNLADKQTDAQISTSNLVVAISRRDEALRPIIDEIDRTSRDLAGARDLRVKWEADPSAPCPLK